MVPFSDNMKVALIHNPNAFQGESASGEMRRLFERAGHEVCQVSTEESNWHRCYFGVKRACDHCGR